MLVIHHSRGHRPQPHACPAHMLVCAEWSSRTDSVMRCWLRDATVLVLCNVLAITSWLPSLSLRALCWQPTSVHLVYEAHKMTSVLLQLTSSSTPSLFKYFKFSP